MAKPVLKHGDTFKVNGKEFEVATISTSEQGVHHYEVLEKTDMDARRKADDIAAAKARREAEEASAADRKQAVREDAALAAAEKQ